MKRLLFIISRFLINQLYVQIGYSNNMPVNTLHDYPKGISEVIFSMTKDFPNNSQLSIAIIENNKTSYYGIIKTNDTIKPINNQNKVFEIGSITKVFTSSILASFVVDDEIKLTDPINSCFPFLFNNNTKITFKDLANHTSGLSRMPENLDLSNAINPYKNYGENQLEEFLKYHIKLENGINKSYYYSNLGAGLLGYTLGLVVNTSIQELTQRLIFDRYKMHNSYTKPNNLDSMLVKGQNPEGEIASNWDWDVLFGAGGALSTTEDLAKFSEAHFNPDNTELALTRIPTFSINENLKIGLGWHIIKSNKGKDIFVHNGGTGGYSSSIAINKDDKAAVVILSNVSGFHQKMNNIEKLCLLLLLNQ